MATRYGHRVFEWLLARGWQPAPPPPADTYGDRRVVDPATGREATVYEAARAHSQRTGESPDFLPEGYA